MLRKKNITVGIIGGQGQMGSWFARWFEKNGCRVIVADLDTELTNQALIAQSDVVVFSVPIKITTRLIGRLRRFSRTDQLWMDLTSLKEGPVRAMLKSEAEVMGVHPLFGPTLKTLKGQTMVLVPARLQRWQGWLEKLLQADQAVITTASARDHDWMMAVVQVITHFSMFSLGHTYQRLGLDILASRQFTSPVYQISLDMIGRYLAQNPYLYADIQMHNPHTREVLQHYLQSVGKLMRIVEDKDREAFVRYAQAAAVHFGEYKAEALKRSDRLIQQLSKGER